MKEMEFLFQRKLYDRMLRWKQEEQGQTALLIEGVRRVGKSTLAETFAKKEYRSYILIDFNKASKETKSLFDDLSSLDFIFLRLQAQYGVQLYERQSVIIFDEVQKCPAARQAIKYLVAQVRYPIPDSPKAETEGTSRLLRSKKTLNDNPRVILSREMR